MGFVRSVGADEFPEQDDSVGSRVVVFQDTGLHGVVLRDDLEEPSVTLYELDDGRVITGDERFGQEYPPQGDWVGRTIVVAFHGDEKKRKFNGVVLRHDLAGPCLILIQLDDKRVVRGFECYILTLDFVSLDPQEVLVM